jgi:glycosyltransferase involved in cell wall biosynthesis
MKDKRKRILIFFDGAHLAYSPTVTQLYDELSQEFEVTIVAHDPEKVTNQRVQNRNVIYYSYRTGKVTYFYRAVYKLLSFFNTYARFLKNNQLDFNVYFSEFLLLKKLLKRKRFDRVIAVDLKNLFLCSVLNQRADFLSLELCANEHLVPVLNHQLIDCVIIQSIERKKYLFKDMPLTVFYVQNAPVFRPISIQEKRKGLIFSGTAWDAFGFYYCLKYINKYPGEQLTVQGVVLKPDNERIHAEYAHLLQENRLVINKKYFENDEVAEYLSHYEIGFCFYNFKVPWIDNYNYKTAPSGKLFKYLAAGVPVVGIDIIGFNFIKEFECGVLINNLDEESIQKAVLKIRDNYKFYVQNAIKAAQHFSFDQLLKPYREYIGKEQTELVR